MIWSSATDSTKCAFSILKRHFAGYIYIYIAELPMREAFFGRPSRDNFAVAKGGFLAGFVQELREHTGRVRQDAIGEIETLLAFRHGRLMIGLFRTGGMMDDIPDSLLRLQQGWAGLRLGHLLDVVAGELTPPLILHTDRVRVEKGKGKGKGPAGAGGGKGAQGKGKGRVGRARPGVSVLQVVVPESSPPPPL